MITHDIDPHEVFWLAKYAHNRIAPLIRAAKQFEPSTTLHIEMSFCDEEGPFHKQNHIGISSHWKRDGMLLQSGLLLTKEDVDRVANNVQRFIDEEQLKSAAA
jgi:hypothetical protein